MRFTRDRRGQSVVVGTVILFGFLILALSIYQVQFVPAENSEIEFEHSQEVEADFLDLRNDILSAGTTGSSRSTSIRLGTRYPQRTFFLNPPAASGTLQTTQERPFEIRNATVDVGDGAHENVRDFWENGTERGTYGPTFDTRGIRYTPSYNEYQGAPELVYENSLIAAEFGDRVLPRSDQTVLRDERVSLTALSGEISENGIEARSVDSETVSRGSRTIPISADGGGEMEIVLPTDTSNPSDLVDRLNVPAEVTANDDQIVITLDSTETYRLGLSEVSVDGSGSTEPAYIVPVGSEEVTAGQSVGVEVRDKYNNPVEGAEVVISDGDDRTTDDDGRVFFNPGSDDSTASIKGSFDPNKPGYESVEFAVSAGGAGSGGGESGVGQGGDSMWSEENTTETISTQGGLWTDIGNINSIVLSNLRLSPVARDGSKAAEERYFRLAFTIGDDFSTGDGTRYVFVLDEEDAYDLDDLGAAEQTVTVYEETKQGGTISASTLGNLDGVALDPTALQALIEDGTELDLLDPSNWEEPNDVDGDLETIRNYLNSSDGQEAFITDVNGRVDLTLEQRNKENGGSGSTPPTVQNGIQYEGGLTSTGSDSAIQFDIRNVGDDFARVVSVRVDSQIGTATELYNGNNGRIIEITGGDSDGFRQTQSGGNPSSRAIAADGTSIDLTQNAVLSTSGGSDDATVSVKQFGTASGNNFNQYDFGTLSRVSENDNWDVEIVLEFQNRADVAFYFEE